MSMPFPISQLTLRYELIGYNLSRSKFPQINPFLNAVWGLIKKKKCNPLLLFSFSCDPSDKHGSDARRDNGEETRNGERALQTECRRKGTEKANGVTGAPQPRGARQAEGAGEKGKRN